MTIGGQAPGGGVSAAVRTSSAPSSGSSTPLDPGAEMIQRHMNLHRNAVAAVHQHNAVRTH